MLRLRWVFGPSVEVRCKESLVEEPRLMAVPHSMGALDCGCKREYAAVSRRPEIVRTHFYNQSLQIRIPSCGGAPNQHADNPVSNKERRNIQRIAGTRMWYVALGQRTGGIVSVFQPLSNLLRY